MYDDCVLEHFVEGTMINVFWDYTINEWNIATRSNIGAKCKFNMDSDKTFRYMFLDAMNTIGMEFEHLNKTYIWLAFIDLKTNDLDALNTRINVMDYTLLDRDELFLYYQLLAELSLFNGEFSNVE